MLSWVKVSDLCHHRLVLSMKKLISAINKLFSLKSRSIDELVGRMAWSIHESEYGYKGYMGYLATYDGKNMHYIPGTKTKVEMKSGKPMIPQDDVISFIENFSSYSVMIFTVYVELPVISSGLCAYYGSIGHKSKCDYIEKALKKYIEIHGLKR